nr:dTDP-4-dehydrorhamnose reductase [Elioraea thermophila]
MPGKPRIIVLGGEGQLGRAVAGAGGDAEILRLSHTAADVTDRGSVAEPLARTRPDVVVDAAAYTAVDRAEREADRRFAVDRDGAGIVAAACAARGIPLVHLSTDHVFDGRKGEPCTEEDPVGPLNVYGLSKAAGESLVLARHEQALIVRTAWLFGAGGGNFIRAIRHRALAGEAPRVVADQRGSPTPAPDLAALLLVLCRRVAEGGRLSGLVHVAGWPDVTWHALAEAAVAVALPPAHRPPIAALATADFPTAARRPADSRLACTRLCGTHGLERPDWQRSLPRIVAAIGMEEAARRAPSSRAALAAAGVDWVATRSIRADQRASARSRRKRARMVRRAARRTASSASPAARSSAAQAARAPGSRRSATMPFAPGSITSRTGAVSEASTRQPAAMA